MTTNEKHSVTVRLDTNEKNIIEEKASKKCMSLNQYIRHVLLENEMDEENEGQLDFRSDDHLKKMTRCILSLRYYVQALAGKSLEKEELINAQNKIADAFKKYGIYESK